MNKKILSVGAFVGMILAGNSYAEDGTITFTGKIQDATCAIVSGDEDQDIDLGVVATKAFRSIGSLAAPTAFSIRLENCPAAVAANGQVSVKFDGNSDTSKTSNSKLFKNDAATGAAGNVAIGIWNSDDPATLSSVLGRGVKSKAVAIDYTVPTAGTATLPFMARYVSTAAQVTAGDVSAVTQFTVMYN